MENKQINYVDIILYSYSTFVLSATDNISIVDVVVRSLIPRLPSLPGACRPDEDVDGVDDVISL